MNLNRINILAFVVGKAKTKYPKTSYEYPNTRTASGLHFASDVCLRSRHFETWFGTLVSSSGAGSRPRGTKFAENSNFLGLHALILVTTILFRSVAHTISHVFGYSSSEGCCSTHVWKQNSRKTEDICGFGSCRGGRYAWMLGSFRLSERKCMLLEKPWQMESEVGSWSH